MNAATEEPDYDILIQQLTYPATKTERRTFSIERPFIEYLDFLGQGNASRGLRIAIIEGAKWRARHDPS